MIKVFNLMLLPVVLTYFGITSVMVLRVFGINSRVILSQEVIKLMTYHHEISHKTIRNILSYFINEILHNYLSIKYHKNYIFFHD
jgi:hypothetical protein